MPYQTLNAHAFCAWAFLFSEVADGPGFVVTGLWLTLAGAVGCVFCSIAGLFRRFSDSLAASLCCISAGLTHELHASSGFQVGLDFSAS